MPKNTTKTTTTATKSKAVKEEVKEKIVEPELDNSAVQENTMLKEQLAKMQAQIELLTRMQMNNNSNTAMNTPKKSNKMIRFVNLKDVTIVLKGTNVWKITGRYNHIDLPEKEARAIALNMSDYLRKGSVYIDDAEFVQENDLDTYYSTLLSDQDLRELLNQDVAKVIEIYKSVNDNQKEVIIDLILDSRKADKKVDNNILVELGELSGRDLINPDKD